MRRALCFVLGDDFFVFLDGFAFCGVGFFAVGFGAGFGAVEVGAGFFFYGSDLRGAGSVSVWWRERGVGRGRCVLTTLPAAS